jgi:hypothetical protein
VGVESAEVGEAEMFNGARVRVLGPQNGRSVAFQFLGDAVGPVKG